MHGKERTPHFVVLVGHHGVHAGRHDEFQFSASRSRGTCERTGLHHQLMCRIWKAQELQGNNTNVQGGIQ